MYQLILWPQSQAFIGAVDCFFYNGESDGSFDDDKSQSVLVPEEHLNSLPAEELSAISDGFAGRYIEMPFIQSDKKGIYGASYVEEDEDVYLFEPED